MEGILKFIIIAILIIYLLGFAVRMLLRYYLKRLAKRQGWLWDPPRQRPEGDVSVNIRPSSKKKADRKVGEYVDYEEV